MNFQTSTDKVIFDKKNLLEKQRDNNFNQIVALNIQNESIKTKIEDLLKKQDIIETQLNLLNELEKSADLAKQYPVTPLSSLNFKDSLSLSTSALSGLAPLTTSQLQNWSTLF